MAERPQPQLSALLSLALHTVETCDVAFFSLFLFPDCLPSSKAACRGVLLEAYEWLVTIAARSNKIDLALDLVKEMRGAKRTIGSRSRAIP